MKKAKELIKNNKKEILNTKTKLIIIMILIIILILLRLLFHNDENTTKPITTTNRTTTTTKTTTSTTKKSAPNMEKITLPTFIYTLNDNKEFVLFEQKDLKEYLDYNKNFIVDILVNLNNDDEYFKYLHYSDNTTTNSRGEDLYIISLDGTIIVNEHFQNGALKGIQKLNESMLLLSDEYSSVTILNSDGLISYKGFADYEMIDDDTIEIIESKDQLGGQKPTSINVSIKTYDIGKKELTLVSKKDSTFECGSKYFHNHLC